MMSCEQACRGFGGMSVEKGVLTSQDWMTTDLGVQLAEVYHWCPYNHFQSQP